MSVVVGWINKDQHTYSSPTQHNTHPLQVEGLAVDEQLPALRGPLQRRDAGLFLQVPPRAEAGGVGGGGREAGEKGRSEQRSV